MKFNINGELKIELPQIDYDRNKKFIIFGIGEVGRNIYEKLCEKVGAEAIHYIIDSAYPNDEYQNTPIIRPDNLAKIIVNDYCYILGTLTNTKTMEKILSDAGVNKEKILVCTDIFSEEKLLESNRKIEKVCIYPCINDIDMLNEQIKKITWFLNPQKTNIIIYFLTELEDVYCYEHIKFISTTDIKQIEFDIMLIWNYYKYKNTNIKAREFYCIDDKYFSIIDLRILISLRYRLTEEKQKKAEIEISVKNFKKYVDKFKRAIIFGSGKEVEMGIKKYLAMQTDKDLKIVCNTAVFNDNLLHSIKPNLYVISDEAFLTQEYADVLNRIIEEVVKNEYLFVVPLKWVPLLKERYNLDTLYEKIVGIEVGANELCFPNTKDLRVYRKAGNVVTRLSIPIGSALCGEIYFIGCDGRKLNYNGNEMWSYSEGLKDETKIVFDQSFKKTVIGDLLNDDYYLIRHYEYMKELIEFGEKQGKKYFSITKSHIPSLRDRTL